MYDYLNMCSYNVKVRSFFRLALKLNVVGLQNVLELCRNVKKLQVRM